MGHVAAERHTFCARLGSPSSQRRRVTLTIVGMDAATARGTAARMARSCGLLVLDFGTVPLAVAGTA